MRSQSFSKKERVSQEDRSVRQSSVFILLCGIVMLFVCAWVSVEYLMRFSADGVLSQSSIEKINVLRQLALIIGSVLVIRAAWELRGTLAAWFSLLASLTWSLLVVQSLYPSNLLLRPDRLVRVALGQELLLSDYDPRSDLKVPAHPVMRAKFPVINIHAHFRHWYQHWTPEQMVAFMDLCNIQHIVDLDGGLGQTLAREVERFATPYPERFTVFATFWFPPGEMDWSSFNDNLAKLAQAKAIGAKGVKIWKNLGLRTKDGQGKIIPVDDLRLEPLWQVIGQAQLPLLIHVGDLHANYLPLDRHNERYEFLSAKKDLAYHGPGAPSLESILGQFENVVSRHPEIIFILAHLGHRTDDFSQAARMLDRHPNLFMDISARVQELGRQPNAARDFLIKYQDRVLFGTDGNPDPEVYRTHFRFLETGDEYFDYPFWPTFNYGRWKIYGVELPDEVLTKIYHDNAANILRLPLLSEVDSRSRR